VGLDQLTADGFVIPQAVRSRPWPGTASLEVAIVWLRRGEWSTPFLLDDKPVSSISSILTVVGQISGQPHRLVANSGISFQGSNVLGMGFVMEPEEAKRLIVRDSRNRDVLFPYLNGEDLNSRPDQSPSRWVINFFDWPLDRDSAPEDYEGPVAADYPDCLEIVERLVKPERALNNDRRRREVWWQFTRPTLDLYAAVSGIQRVLVGVLHTKHWSVAVYESRIIYSHALVVFVLDSPASQALLESFVHEAWAREYSGSLETRMRYTPSDCFETFPFPQVIASLLPLGPKQA
jgi:hypothetical protein